MLTVVPTSLSLFSSASAAGQAMHNYIAPTIITLSVLATLVAAALLVNGGFQLMTSSGHPERLEHGKLVIRNSLIGLIIILAAGTGTAILNNAYTSNGSHTVKEVPALEPVQPDKSSDGLSKVLIDAIAGLFRSLIETIAKPFLSALSYFTKGTPLMADNSSVFNLWLAIVAITDALFVLAVILIGFHIMSFASFGLEELEFKHLIPQLVVTFLLINTSIFAIDAVITVSNGMIDALYKGFSPTPLWDSLTKVASQSAALDLGALIIFVVFIILSVMLLIYYIIRLVMLYLGAVLSPLVFLLMLLPSFRDFAVNAVKTYLTTVFVLFIHVVILILAASIFAGMASGDPSKALNPIMSVIVGIAVMLSLLKTQTILFHLSQMSSGARTGRKLGQQFIRGATQIKTKIVESRSAATPSKAVIKYHGAAK